MNPGRSVFVRQINYLPLATPHTNHYTTTALKGWEKEIINKLFHSKSKIKKNKKLFIFVLKQLPLSRQQLL